MINGLALGCFDILHFGHVAHLEAAKALCDRLTVSVTPDEQVNKGPGRPVFPVEQRAAVLRALRCVDCVVVTRGDAVNMLRWLKPQRYIKGAEYETNNHPGFLREKQYCEANGIEVVFTNEPTFSSTETLRRLNV